MKIWNYPRSCKLLIIQGVHFMPLSKFRWEGALLITSQKTCQLANNKPELSGEKQQDTMLKSYV